MFSFNLFPQVKCARTRMNLVSAASTRGAANGSGRVDSGRIKSNTVRISLNPHLINGPKLSHLHVLNGLSILT